MFILLASVYILQAERKNEKRKLSQELDQEWEVKLKELTEKFDKEYGRKLKKMKDGDRNVRITSVILYFDSFRLVIIVFSICITI